MTLPSNFLEDLQKNYYAPVPFEIDRQKIDEAMAAFFAFLALPDAVKNHIDFTIAPMHRRGDVGYKKRTADDHMYNDDKEFFHFHPAVFERYADFIEQNPALHNFLLKAKPIWDLAAQKIDEALSAFETNEKDVRKKVFDTQHPHILLRFLKYSWHESGKYLAKPHFDAGSFSLAIAESGPGLRIGSGPDDLALIKHQPQKAVFMIASNFKKIMDTDDFKPGWHDVIQLDESHIGKPYARWALVAFVEAADVAALPRAETHKFYDPNNKEKVA